MQTRDDLLAEAFGRVDAALSVTDPAGRLLFASDAFVELFGWSVNDDINISVLTPEGHRSWPTTYANRLMNGDLDEYRANQGLVRRDGTDFIGELVVRPIWRDGHCVGLVVSVTPTPRRELVEDPRASKLLEHNASTITLVDDTGAVIETAGRYRATLGYPPEFWDSRSIFDLLSSEDATKVLELREQIMRTPDEVITTDIGVRDAAGVEHVLEATAVNLLEDPDVRGIVITSRNVTDERSNRDQLARLRDQAVAEAERRSTLIATVSHELRNPLHALAGLSELLASAAHLDEGLRSIATTLHRQVEQMARVTDDLLEHTRLELDTSEPRLEPTHVRDLIDDVVALARASAGTKPVTVNTAVDPDVPSAVSTDGSRLHQLVWNLVDNAIKFTERGRVDISVSVHDAVPGRMGMRIEIADTGTGVAVEDLDRIFEPFHTSAPTTGQSGAGLGLAITQRMVVLLGGEITVQSAIGRGSTFTIDIPVGSVQDDTRAVVDAAGVPADSGHPVVLVVEDNEVNQQLARHQLDRMQMTGVIVGSAEDAIDWLEGHRADAVLMDHQLPGMNGREATRALRVLGIETPIIGITASATAADEQACLDAGMDAFLPKPVGLDQLRVALESVIKHHSGRITADTGPPHEHLSGAIDDATLANLANELNDPAIVASLVTTFLGELDQRRSDILAADDQTAARQAHSLKSSARMLGAFALADACESLEAQRVGATEVIAQADAAEVAFNSWLDQHHDGSQQ